MSAFYWCGEPADGAGDWSGGGINVSLRGPLGTTNPLYPPPPPHPPPPTLPTSGSILTLLVLVQSNSFYGSPTAAFYLFQSSLFICGSTFSTLHLRQYFSILFYSSTKTGSTSSPSLSAPHPWQYSTCLASSSSSCSLMAVLFLLLTQGSTLSLLALFLLLTDGSFPRFFSSFYSTPT